MSSATTAVSGAPTLVLDSRVCPLWHLGRLTRREPLVHGLGGRLVTAETGEREVGLGEAWGHLGHADTRGDELLEERLGECLDGAGVSAAWSERVVWRTKVG